MSSKQSRVPPKASPKKVLIVEGNDLERQITADLWREDGYVVLEASTRWDAIRILETEPSDAESATWRPVDAVITALTVPELEDGFALLEWMRDYGPDVPTIVVGAATSKETVNRALELGAFEYVMKPCGAEELLSAVENALAGVTPPGYVQPECDSVSCRGLTQDDTTLTARERAILINLVRIDYWIEESVPVEETGPWSGGWNPNRVLVEFAKWKDVSAEERDWSVLSQVDLLLVGFAKSEGVSVEDLNAARIETESFAQRHFRWLAATATAGTGRWIKTWSLRLFGPDVLLTSREQAILINFHRVLPFFKDPMGIVPRFLPESMEELVLDLVLTRFAEFQGLSVEDLNAVRIDTGSFAQRYFRWLAAGDA